MLFIVAGKESGCSGRCAEGGGMHERCLGVSQKTGLIGQAAQMTLLSLPVGISQSETISPEASDGLSEPLPTC